MRLFLVRHGETESNRLNLVLGRDDVPLNQRGKWQAERVGRALAREPLTAVYSSPLRRTLDTARALAAPHDLTVQIEQGLIEMDVGEADGLTLAEVGSRFPDLLKKWSSEEGPNEPMPGGDSLVDVQERAWPAVQDIAARHADEAVAAVAHNFVILSLLVRVLGIRLTQFRRLRHSLAAISVVDFLPARALLIRMNDTCHLEAD